jgi:hypothetical protein
MGVRCGPPIAFDKNAFGITYDTKKAFGGLPHVSPGGFTMMWSVYTDAHTQDFGTHWFYAKQDNALPDVGGVKYFGCANRLDPPTTGTWRHSISAFGLDFWSTDVITLGRWYRQAYKRREYATGVDHFYYYDLPDLTKVVTATTSNTDIVVPTSTYQLRFCDNTWATLESIDGGFGPIKIWEDYLPNGVILAEASSRWPVSREYLSSLFACIPNVTFGSMKDYSGRGNNFSIIINDNSKFRPIGDPTNTSWSRPVAWTKATQAIVAAASRQQMLTMLGAGV